MAIDLSIRTAPFGWRPFGPSLGAVVAYTSLQGRLKIDETALRTLFRGSAAGEIYTIGAGNEITNRELTDRLVGLCGRDESAIEYVPDRPGHDRRYSLDCSKLHALGWAPAQDFSAGLAETVEWYSTNRHWWEPLKNRPGTLP